MNADPTESIVASLQSKDCTLIELSGGKSPFPSTVRIGIVGALNTIQDEEAAIALGQPEHSKGNFDNLFLERLRNRLPGFLIEIKSHVSPGPALKTILLSRVRISLFL